MLTLKFIRPKLANSSYIPKTLLARFMLIIVVPSLIGQILAVFLFYDRHWYNVSYYTSNIIANEIKWLLDNYHNVQTTDTNQHINEYLNLSYQFYQGIKLSKIQPKLNEELEIFKNILNLKLKKPVIVTLNHEKKIVVSIAFNSGLLKITFPTKLLLNPTTYIFVSWLIFLTILLLSVSLIFSRNQIKSILELAAAADAFGREQRLDYKPSGAYEIRQAGLAFLKMKDRIDKQIANRTQMLAMISHDLRTPLTRMKLQLELMPSSEATVELQQDIDTMTQMIATYLDFARSEGGESFQIVEVADWVVNFIQTKYPGHDIAFDIRSHKHKVQIKPFAFARAISNLINNAIKYSTKIKISISETKTSTLIEIEDNGVGIRDQEKKLVFKPFYRSDHARSLEYSSNVGLGLAITKEIITGHYGTITLADSKLLNGLLVRISLPITTHVILAQGWDPEKNKDKTNEA
ncbi:ATP-binding protein [Candidatus Trichorickettsia mobilis]|uniref:ATP-binding protein n=1 Tax=Candidatus Trichorickettsia mobilis TaxID=1346319 RepID=UPI00292F5300|nr:ATP-binding protein [Candidatus Trichorickettsia mobilis]